MRSLQVRSLLVRIPHTSCQPPNLPSHRYYALLLPTRHLLTLLSQNSYGLWAPGDHKPDDAEAKKVKGMQAEKPFVSEEQGLNDERPQNGISTASKEGVPDAQKEEKWNAALSEEP